MGAEVSREGISGETGLGDLPEGCLAEIMLRLEPPEICRLARLCRTFRGAASADLVWEAKLPGNYRYLLGKLLENENSRGRKLSKKEIFALLCRRNAFNGSNTEFFLEKNRCLICISISSKELLITGINDRRHWNFIPTPESSHVYYMSGDAWKEGGIDVTGSLMVLTLRVISCAMNYSDGLLKDENLSEAQKKHRLICCPSLIEYIGYCLCCGSHFAGPVFEMKDYLEWTERRGTWSPHDSPLPSLLGATLHALLQAAIYMGLYLQLVPKFPLSQFNEPIYQD